MGRQSPRQFAREGQQRGGAPEQRIEIEPQIAVMARLKDEMPAPGGQQFEKLLFHATENLGMLRPCRSKYTPPIWSPA